ncbi:MAG: GYF domain-containing protein [Kofleriaceae bacterium]
MKFLCDRCKTRYSIGDDRVRGKILKIRCKNCANVITVREGMTADEGDAGRGRPTTAAPLDPKPANGALASAFASQLQKPPPSSLEEEWYVSIDGDQQGPFSLADAQTWISEKPHDADIHCWSEGFDDWLSVDKVSHFRPYRKKAPAPTTPPPMPARPAARAPAMAAVATRPAEDEPKPLFAATMASLEKATGVPATPMTPPTGVPKPVISAKANGTGSAPVPRGTDSGISQAISPSPQPNINNNGAGPNRSSVQGGAKALAFDSSESGGESMTTVDAAAFPDKLGSGSNKALPKAEPEPPPPDEDDSLDIGEVSRVVNLADLAKQHNAKKQTRAMPSLRTTGSQPKIDPGSFRTGPVQRMSVADVANPLVAEPVATEPAAVAAPVVAQAHRRGLIMLIGVAALLLAGVAVMVVVMMTKNDTDSTGGLGSTHQIDTSRPEDLILKQLPHDTGSATPNPNTGGQVKRPNTGGQIATNNPKQNDLPGETEGKGDKLKSDEIEDMARKQSAGTQRCYMRAQRGAEGIEIADLKKLSVTLTVDKTGAISDVTLSEHQTDTLGQCLISQIKRWKFRESPGGAFRIVLAFAS